MEFIFGVVFLVHANFIEDSMSLTLKLCLLNWNAGKISDLTGRNI